MIRVALLLSLTALAQQQQSPDNWQRRDAVLRSAVEQAEAAHPSDLHRVDSALLDLAQFLKDRGQYFEAEPLYVRSSVINEKLYGGSSIQSAQSLLRLGAIYHSELRLSDAEATARKAVDLFQTISGPDSLGTAYAAANLAVILADEGQPARAEPSLRRALSILRQHATLETSSIEALIEENLAMVHLRQGEYRKATPLLEDALRKLESTDDPSRANTLAALAELAIAEHRWQQADMLIREAYKLVLDRQGEDHPWLIGILHLKAAIEVHSGQLSDASADMRRSIDLLEVCSGTNSPRLAILLEDRSIILRRLGRNAEAKADRARAKVIRTVASKQ